MLKTAIESRIGIITSFGAAGVTLLVTDRISTEPVNVGKMVLLTVVSFGAFSLVVPYLRKNLSQHALLLFTGLVFLLFGFASIFTSANPWYKGFYGTFGRNTGFLTYLCFFLLLFVFSLCRREKSFVTLINALYFAGATNIVISLVDISGGKVFSWDNPSRNVLGTFGNTNFISSFMGIFVTALAAFALKPGVKLAKRFFAFIFILLGIYVTLETNSTQGLVVIALGFSIVFYFFITNLNKNPFLKLAYFSVVGFAGVMGILGTLQIGPLKDLLYKPSISFRGEYWAAGIRMGLDNFINGVGFDSYGTFFRIYRDAGSIVSPGVNVVTDTAHNVPIDIFAGIGAIGFLAYAFTLTIVLVAAYRVMRARKTYDFLFVALFSSWCCYQIQSLISINQIGLGVWGWILGGALIGYSKIQSPVDTPQNELSKTEKGKSKVAQSEEIPASAVLLLTSSLVIGFVIALPPFLADAKMRSAVESTSGDKVAQAAVAFPMDTFRLNKAAVAFVNSNLNSLAIEMAMTSIKHFPEDYRGWFVLYELTPESDSRRIEYINKLHMLDPLNPEFVIRK